MVRFFFFFGVGPEYIYTKKKMEFIHQPLIEVNMFCIEFPITRHTKKKKIKVVGETRSIG